MDKRVLTICLSTDNNRGCYFYADLSLPAKGYEILDVYQKLRCSSRGDEPLVSELRCEILPELSEVRLDAPTIKELDFFARRLTALSDAEQLALRGLFLRFLNEDMPDDLISMRDLINMTYGLDQVTVAWNVGDDEALGQFVIENDLHQDVSVVPDEALYLLDKAAIGRHQREIDSGVFIAGAYVATGNYELPEEYDGITLPETEIESWFAFRLKVASSTGSTEDSTEWIDLPIRRPDANLIALAHGESCIENCICCGFESSIPQITEQHFHDMKEFGKLNRLALMLAELAPADLMRFKAVLELESPADMDGIMDAVHHHWDYSFADDLDDEDSYFKDYLCQHLPEGFDPEWLEDLSCQSEGNHLLRCLGGMVTDYGVIAGQGYNLYDIVPFRETPVAAFEEVENEEPQLGGMQL